MTDRFIDRNKTIYSFSDHFLVVCPRCCAQATVRSVVIEEKTRQNSLICENCGYAKRQEQSVFGSYVFNQDPVVFNENEIGIGAPVDWYFHLPLWLQTECIGHMLWAYNLDHLNYLTEYVEAEVHERRRDEYGWRNSSLASRLPKWIKKSKNRNAVLKGIKDLKVRLSQNLGKY